MINLVGAGIPFEYSKFVTSDSPIVLSSMRPAIPAAT